MIDQEKLLKIYDSPQSPYYLLDVRTEAEFSDHRIPGSINIPIDKLEQNLEKLPKDKCIVTVCEHGVRSGRAAEFLKQKGYDAKNLKDGLTVWKGQIEKGE